MLRWMKPEGVTLKHEYMKELCLLLHCNVEILRNPNVQIPKTESNPNAKIRKAIFDI